MTGSKSYTLLGADGKPYQSASKGQLGGHRRTRIYGRLDCPAALRAIARGGYTQHRVFFADGPTAIAAGYRPCATCCPARYRQWKAARQRQGAEKKELTMNQPASLFDDLTSAGGDAQYGQGDWAAVRARLESDGIALTPPLLSEAECREARAWFDDPGRFRSTVVMQRHGFGRGTYRYFADPLPGLVRELRDWLYPPLAGIANEWATRLGERQFPVTHGELAAECAAAGQAKPTPLLLHYGPGDHANLHQDLYGDIVFPLQVAIMLSKPGEEFDGGESVFVEQRPRSQSRAIIARPAQGQGIVFPVRHRPVPGSHGYRRHAMRHGSGDVSRGNRTVLGIIFHNAR